ncbi:MAG: hypothetical protein R2856_39525 [Caldilineaceae bacterium]
MLTCVYADNIGEWRIRSTTNVRNAISAANHRRCQGRLHNARSAVDHAYAAALEEWRTQRDSELRRPDGWLSLAGLFWLSAGRSSFGSAPDNDIIFPADKAAPVIGDFVLENGQVRRNSGGY